MHLSLVCHVVVDVWNRQLRNSADKGVKREKDESGNLLPLHQKVGRRRMHCILGVHPGRGN